MAVLERWMRQVEEGTRMLEVLSCSYVRIRGLIRVYSLTCKILRLCSWIYWIPSLQLQRKNACMGGCLGGYVRPPAAALPEQANRPFKIRSNRWLRGQSARSCQDWWMSSSNEIGAKSVFSSQARRNLSKSFNDCRKSGSASHDNDKFSFENLALANWHKQRQEWVGSQKPEPRQLREPVIRWSATYEVLLGTSRPFIELVPLPEIVDFLVDVWARPLIWMKQEFLHSNCT